MHGTVLFLSGGGTLAFIGGSNCEPRQRGAGDWRDRVYQSAPDLKRWTPPSWCCRFLGLLLLMVVTLGLAVYHSGTPFRLPPARRIYQAHSRVERIERWAALRTVAGLTGDIHRLYFTRLCASA